jgi:glycosyltransferase involved in cell wall biosynthesis
MTLSMIYGTDKAFLSEASSLVGWIEQHGKPDIIHISTSLLMGIAQVIRQRMDTPIVCSLKDEEVWLDKMRAEFIAPAWKGIADSAPLVDKFVTVSDYYKRYIQARIPELTNVEVVYPGLTLPEKQAALPEHPTIGYLSRFNHDNGADILCKAFVILKQRNTIPNLRLKMGGGYTREDNRFVASIKRMLKPYHHDVELLEQYDVSQPERFMEQLSVLSVPLRFDEGIGLYVCQAYTAGRPAVMPASGSFPEIVGNGGLLYEPNDPQRLADALEKILTDKHIYETCCANALAIAKERFGDKQSAQALEQVYRKIKG